MTVSAFEGPAGCGKTFSLMGQLLSELERSRLSSGRRVLALTRIHGSRRRLDAKLAEISGLKGQFEASTIDSFAWRLCTRWRSLLRDLGHDVPQINAYDDICSLAALLLSRSVVRDWVINSFPLIIVDEAQDLSQSQSIMVQHLSTQACVLLAYDHFQCLDESLRPIAVSTWLPGSCSPTLLTQNRRTNGAELLAAGAALREGLSLSLGGTQLKVKVAGPSGKGAPKLAAVMLYYASLQQGDFALLTPSRRGGFAESIVTLAQTGFQTKNNKVYQPILIQWEQSDRDNLDAAINAFQFPPSGQCNDIISALSSIVDPHILRDIENGFGRRRRTTGQLTASRAEVISQLESYYSRRRKFGHKNHGRLKAMTIHQAKNREFDHVVVVWPFSVPATDDQRRRLLYNAITRAKRSCVVLVQGAAQLSGAPFVGV